MARRRPTGTVLLAATAGISVLACSGIGGPEPIIEVTGNLVAPPMINYCVTVEPAEAGASVTVNGMPLDEQGCAWVEEWNDVVVDASAPGFETYTRTAEATAPPTTVVLIPEGDDPAPEAEPTP